MQGQLVPEGIDWAHGAGFALDPRPLSASISSTAGGRGSSVAALVIFARKVKPLEPAARSIAIHRAFGTQILLGIATVMTGVAIWLAVLHQAVGALLVAATVWGAHAHREAAA